MQRQIIQSANIVNLPCKILSRPRRRAISFSHYFWVRIQKLSTVPERTVRINEQLMLFTRPLASAKDCTPQKSNTAFLKISKSLWRRTWGFAVLWCWCFFNAVIRWIKSQLAVLRWSQTLRCAMFHVFFTLRCSVKWNCLRCWGFFIYLSQT